MSTKVNKRSAKAAERRRLARRRQTRRRLILAGVAALTGVGVVVVVALTQQSAQQSPVALPKGVGTEQQGNVRVGERFSDFEVTEVGGRTLTGDSLQGKPAIVWFTTSYCVPCQVGARDAAKLDDELGGKAFDVLVIFVDLAETPADLSNWRKEFARPDWMVALDGDLDLSRKVGLRSLDSKFLLDREGLIQNIDFAQVNDRYLSILRQTVRQSS